METDLLPTAARLRKQAEQLLQEICFPEWTAQYGTIEPTGSYLYDLMTWPDLDCTVRLHPEKDPTEALWEWARTAQGKLAWQKFNMQKFEGPTKPWWPRGFYLGLLLQFPPEEANCQEWKVDLWILTAEEQRRADLFNQEVMQRLTPEMRLLILEWKQRLMEGGSRVPQQASRHLYQAILWEGLREPEAIVQYLHSRGVLGGQARPVSP